MKKISVLLGILILSSCKNTTNFIQKEQIKKAKVSLESKSNSNVTGKVLFVQKNNVVTMEVLAEGLPQGNYAIHIHEKSDCSSPDGTSAGAHWNPTHQPHGKWGSEKGYHKGDIGNITATKNGKAKLTFKTDEWCLGCGDETKDLIGHSVIIHQKEDDFKTQPTGNAGGRVSCGGIIEILK